jgi:hypothetical protein
MQKYLPIPMHLISNIVIAYLHLMHHNGYGPPRPLFFLAVIVFLVTRTLFAAGQYSAQLA